MVTDIAFQKNKRFIMNHAYSYLNRLFIHALVIIGFTMFHAHGLLATEPAPPIQTTLSLDSHPPLGEPAQLTCEITSIIDAQATEAYIELPHDTKVLDGDLNWKGELVAHERVQFSVSIVFETGGQKEIFCRVKVTGETAPYDALAGLASLDLFVGQIKRVQFLFYHQEKLEPTLLISRYFEA
jgi:hypothetical protein